MFGYLIIRESAPKPPIKYYPWNGQIINLASRRLGLVLWYTSGFQ